MSPDAGESMAHAEGGHTPWYARRSSLIGAAIAAGVGVILLVIGVVSFLAASSTVLRF